MDDADDATPMEVVDPELRQLLGLFDAPAFARRAQDLEYHLARLHDRCRRERAAMLEMVRVRLRQWAGAASGPDDWHPIFAEPVAPLWPLCGAEPPVWADGPAPMRRRRAIARDLVASLERFNRRWARFLDELNLQSVNALIDQYNRYYTLEKECSLGSARLAARFFSPRPHVTADALRAECPALPVPGLRRVGGP
jgi:hypothetical protein